MCFVQKIGCFGKHQINTYVVKKIEQRALVSFIFPEVVHFSFLLTHLNRPKKTPEDSPRGFLIFSLTNIQNFNFYSLEKC